jgi:sulfite exporter TauE/SafE
MVVLAFLAMGFASSAHCLAMCGPLVVAWRQQVPGAAAFTVYHASRVAAYAALGAAAGAAGGLIAGAGLGGLLSVTLGVLLIAAAFGKVSGRVASFGIGRLVSSLAGRSRRALAAHPLATSSVAGVVNAVIPCGLVYAALGAAVATADPLQAAAAMAAYGAGTIPALITVWWSAQWFGRRFARWRFVTPAALAIAGLLLVGRGLDDHRSAHTQGASLTHIGH